jgi:hypothetical protein
MGLTIIERGQGYEIYRSDSADSIAPYSPEKRDDGSENYGFKDLRDQPELVDSIPEASKSNGLAEILRAANSPGSEIMTLGCECVLNDRENYVGSYVSIAFRASERNKPDSLASLGSQFMKKVRVKEPHEIRIALFVQPLRDFFGAANCFELMLKVFGYGATPERAWAALEHGALASSVAIRELGSRQK